MERRRFVRLLRVSTAAVCLAATTVLLVAWVRNFWVADVVWAPLPEAGQLVMASADGQLEFGISYSSGGWAAPAATSWGWQSYTTSQNPAVKVVVPWKTVVRYRMVRNGMVIVLPHWLLFITTLLVATLPWIHWSRRFTIRTLLIVTTLVTVVLAMAATAGE